MSKRIGIILSLALLAGCSSGTGESVVQKNGVFHAPSVVSDLIDVVGSPDADVRIHVVSMDESVSDMSVAGVFIQPQSWNNKYAFDIKCHDDADGQDQIAILAVSDDGNYHAIHQVRTVVCQNGEGVVVAPVAKADAVSTLDIQPDVLNIESGQSGQFEISLAYQPINPVIVMAIPLSDNPELASRIFSDAECFSQEGSVVMSAVQSETRYDLNILSECTHDFDDLLTIDISAYNLTYPEEIVDPVIPEDPVIPGSDDEGDDGDINDNGPSLSADELFEFSKTSLYVRDSGGADGFTIRLLVQPDDDVVISLISADPGEFTVEPSTLTFTHDNWLVPQNVRVSGVSDGIKDGSQFVEMNFEVVSTDSDYDGVEVPAIYVQTADDDAPQSVDVVKFRAMAANITSGSKQAYSPGHGIRIFQAAHPDVVLINEFNMYSGSKDTEADIRLLVDKAFGPEFYYHHGNGAIPNGIVSRFPITSSGAWKSNIISNRDWDWAVVDLPGDKDLLAVSVHLSTDKNGQEMPLLVNEIQKKIDQDAKRGIEYYVLVGGDFNTKSRGSVKSNFSSIFVTSAPYPVDQNGNEYTNAKRTSPYDWLLCSRDLCKKEIPVEIGAHTGENAYTNGHVFDTRVYGKYSVENARDKEISYVSPAQTNDSGASNMQHMAVIRDFEISY